ncbi:unnamed protein product [Tuber melanosporum]|uniref:(Perigord truffle) hypothetical protein n=1 Tax=Tuber melanosporum (strain Mel28) TaxID=656061 RepID=D5GCG2_TUBMM|nr:uncharacterized protein GSTUM_00005877001 [Tuber melanosporum]CAZ82205.1 unnamed protein product [Tuber melanosporum]
MPVRKTRSAPPSLHPHDFGFWGFFSSFSFARFCCLGAAEGGRVVNGG